jgi:hypothetical protein
MVSSKKAEEGEQGREKTPQKRSDPYSVATRAEGRLPASRGKETHGTSVHSPARGGVARVRRLSSWREADLFAVAIMLLYGKTL